MFPHEEQEAPTFFVDGYRGIPCDVTSASVLPQKDIEESLAMGDIDENMKLGSTNKGDYPFKDLVYKDIIETNDQICTKLACNDGELFDMHALKGIPHEILIWKYIFHSNNVVDHIPYG